MLTIQIGWGFPFRAERANLSNADVAPEYKKADSFVLSAGVVSVCWWNAAAAKMWVKCMRLSAYDAAIVADAPAEISRRIESGIAEQFAKECSEHEAQSDQWWKQHHEAEEEKRELRGEIHDLKTALRVLATRGRDPKGEDAHAAEFIAERWP